MESEAQSAFLFRAASVQRGGWEVKLGACTPTYAKFQSVPSILALGRS